MIGLIRWSRPEHRRWMASEANKWPQAVTSPALIVIKKLNEIGKSSGR